MPILRENWSYKLKLPNYWSYKWLELEIEIANWNITILKYKLKLQIGLIRWSYTTDSIYYTLCYSILNSSFAVIQIREQRNIKILTN